MSTWNQICPLEDIPVLGSRVVQRQIGGDIAIFRTEQNEVFALHDQCPHKKGPLSQGLVHGRQVTCPLHGWNVDLVEGAVIAPDVGSCSKFKVKIEDGQVYLSL